MKYLLGICVWLVWLNLACAPSAPTRTPTLALTLTPTRMLSLTVTTIAATHLPTSTIKPTRVGVATLLPRTPTPTLKPTSIGRATPSTPTPSTECKPSAQDAYVYFDWRFSVVMACVRVSGTVRRAFVNTGDGDGLIDLELDAPYRHYLTPGNRKVVSGYLHMEIVCYGKPPYKESWATDACAGNHSPVRDPLPKAGQRLWAEGRLVQDVFHEDIAELHPLYRWAVVK